MMLKSAIILAAVATASLGGCASDYEYGTYGYPEYGYTGSPGYVVERNNYYVSPGRTYYPGYYNRAPGYWDQRRRDSEYNAALYRQQAYREGLQRQEQLRQNHQANVQLQRDLAAKRAAEARSRAEDRRVHADER